MAGGRTSLYERQWNEVDALKSIYIVSIRRGTVSFIWFIPQDEFEEVTHPWKVDHPPNFIMHLSCTDAGNTCAIDINFKYASTQT